MSPLSIFHLESYIIVTSLNFQIYKRGIITWVGSFCTGIKWDNTYKELVAGWTHGKLCHFWQLLVDTQMGASGKSLGTGAWGPPILREREEERTQWGRRTQSMVPGAQGEGMSGRREITWAPAPERSLWDGGWRPCQAGGVEREVGRQSCQIQGVLLSFPAKCSKQIRHLRRVKGQCV